MSGIEGTPDLFLCLVRSSEVDKQAIRHSATVISFFFNEADRPNSYINSQCLSKYLNIQKNALFFKNT
ncbi:MAG: hypothetical protein CBB77_11225 [Hyphomonas sp. TMED17]|nr:MAG: hypothetical protein CBB77_11225 [Hyphomonas sp. TMED17]